MKYIILLSVLLTIYISNTTKAYSMPCYFPGGTYRMIAYLKKHNCTVSPREQIVLKKIKFENQLCGVYYENSNKSFYTVLFIEQKKISGIIFVLDICSAIYSVEFIKEN